jgi:ceramide glucosyltransferase
MLLYLLIALALIQGVISLRDGLRNARYAVSYASPEGPAGRVIVFCPVKGLEAGLDGNVRSLQTQRHPDYRVVFLVDEPEDPAVRVLEAAGAEVWPGGRSDRCSQKVHNLLRGIDRFGPEADIWVFADADARFPPDWLEQLIAPLTDSHVGASTGYRWYVPDAESPASLVRSAWNATVAGFLGPHENNFVWGGSMAIRRDVFVGAGIGRLWERAVSDDYALTYGVRRHGLRIAYVPPCLVPSYGAIGWRELLEFTTRQIRITRVYAPRIWRVSFVSYTLFNLTFLWMSVLILAGRWWLLGPWLAVYGLATLRSEVRRRAVRHAISHPSLETRRWFYRLATPLVALLYQVNFVLSALSRRIVWKDVVYRMISPEETQVEFRQ